MALSSPEPPTWIPTPTPHNRSTPSGFHVGYEIKDSSVAIGKGLFATHFVPKGMLISASICPNLNCYHIGTLLWKYQSGARNEFNVNVWSYSNEDEVRARLAEVSPEDAAYIMDHVYMFDGRLNEICDDGKMWNHSEEPNTGLPPPGEEYCWESTYAIRDIEAGEEFLVPSPIPPGTQIVNLLAGHMFSFYFTIFSLTYVNFYVG